jgi:hypothetical protein
MMRAIDLQMDFHLYRLGGGSRAKSSKKFAVKHPRLRWTLELGLSVCVCARHRYVGVALDTRFQR